MTDADDDTNPFPYTATRMHVHRHGAWFRIRGYGLRVINHRRVPQFFSERNGYGGPYLHLGRWCVKRLTPTSHGGRK